MIGWRVVRFALSLGAVAASGAASAGMAMPRPPAATLQAGEHRITASDGTSLYVKVAGKGPACMLIHGGPGQGTLSTEKMGADALESFLTMIYVDQRGSGKSADAADYHLSQVTRDFETVRKALGVERMCLIAHSFGGLLAVDYARTFPDRVSSLVLANATLAFLGPDNARMQIAFANQLLGKTVATAPAGDDPPALEAALDQARSAVRKAGLGYRFLTRQTGSIERMSELDSSYARSRGFGRAVFEEAGKYPEYRTDFAPASAQVRQPVLVLTSREDHAVGPDEYRRFRFPNQTVVTLEGGHISYYEQNAAFVEAIRGFLVRAPAKPRRR